METSELYEINACKYGIKWKENIFRHTIIIRRRRILRKNIGESCLVFRGMVHFHNKKGGSVNNVGDNAVGENLYKFIHSLHCNCGL